MKSRSTHHHDHHNKPTSCFHANRCQYKFQYKDQWHEEEPVERKQKPSECTFRSSYHQLLFECSHTRKQWTIQSPNKSFHNLSVKGLVLIASIMKLLWFVFILACISEYCDSQILRKYTPAEALGSSCGTSLLRERTAWFINKRTKSN